MNNDHFQSGATRWCSYKHKQCFQCCQLGQFHDSKFEKLKAFLCLVILPGPLIWVQFLTLMLQKLATLTSWDIVQGRCTHRLFQRWIAGSVNEVKPFKPISGVSPNRNNFLKIRKKWRHFLYFHFHSFFFFC